MATANVENQMNLSQTRFDHSDKISARRKALFPNDDSDSDLGHISPLHSGDSNSNFSDVLPLEPTEVPDIFKHKLADYDIIFSEPIPSKPIDPKGTPTFCRMSPLYISPTHSLLVSPILYSPHKSTQPNTPLGKSPSTKMKTPHDTSTVKQNVKQPKRRLQDIIAQNDEEITQEPECKQAKLHANKSKVRTALFPENDMSLSVNMFYPKITARTERKQTVTRKTTKQRASKQTYLCGRRNGKRYGQINAGVRHKIKKPKLKKANKDTIMKAALNIIEKSQLNEYLENMACLKKTSSPKQIKKIENAIEIIQNKENLVKQEEAQYDEKKKFFKSNRHRGSVTITENIKLEVSKDKIKLENNCNKRKHDFQERDENVNINMNQILNVLKSAELDPLLKSELILSPTSQMCDMASGLAINSPKRAKLNINSLLEKCGENNVFNASSAEMERKKLFPIFCGGQQVAEEKKPVRATQRKWKKLPANQMLLDAGQKKFGLKQCPECEACYHEGDPNDELRHLNYHNNVNVFKFNGWKNERVVQNFGSGRVITIIPGDSKIWWKKVKDLLEVINRDLGYYDTPLSIENTQVYLYIINKTIAGCLVAEQKTKGYLMLSNTSGIDLCSEESYPIKCGISRIWVQAKHRKTGIATQMMNALRHSFYYGMILLSTDIAFSSPTEQGKNFATKYFKTKNFLIYTE